MQENTKPNYVSQKIKFKGAYGTEEVEWKFPSRYSDLKSLGEGTFGCVCSAVDSQRNNEIVAIKRLKKPFTDQETAKRSYREIAILNEMNSENVLYMIDIFTPQISLEFLEEIYIVTHRMNYSLSELIYSVEVELHESTILFYVYQILRALKYLHSADIIHRDLKPANIGVNTDHGLRIMDFGLARTVKDDDDQTTKTGYVATRWYRAPEIIYNWCKYNCKVDIWSVGCIMAELFNRTPFLKGDSKHDQLFKTLETLGSPDQELLDKMISEPAAAYLRTLQHYPGRDFADLVPSASQCAREMMARLLVIDPDRRLSAVDALSHPYFGTLRCPEDEPVRDRLELNENEELTTEQWKERIWQHIEHFRPSPPNEKPGV